MSLNPAPRWYTALPLATLVRKCSAYGLDPSLIASICQQESDGNTWAVRFEAGQTKNARFNYLDTARSNGITADTEKLLQCSSWGLMQVMGWVARGLGYARAINQLCDPEFGLEYGCRLVSDLFKRFGPDEDAVIAAYNAGSPRKDPSGKYVNQAYVDGVKGFLAELRGPRA